MDTFNGRLSGSLYAWVWDSANATVKLKIKTKEPSDPLSSGDLQIQLKLKGVLDGTGELAGSTETTPAGTLDLSFQVTKKDRMFGDMTLITFPLSIGVPMVDGKSKVKTTMNAALNGLGANDLADCSVVSLPIMFSLSPPATPLTVKDPNGNMFAVPGLFAAEVPGGL